MESAKIIAKVRSVTPIIELLALAGWARHYWRWSRGEVEVIPITISIIKPGHITAPSSHSLVFTLHWGSANFETLHFCLLTHNVLINVFSFIII